MWSFSETTSAHKNGPSEYPNSVAQQWVVARKKENEIYMQIHHKDFWQEHFILCKAFRLTFKYAKVSATSLVIQYLVSDHKLSKNVFHSVRIHRTMKMFGSKSQGR